MRNLRIRVEKARIKGKRTGDHEELRFVVTDRQGQQRFTICKTEEQALQFIRNLDAFDRACHLFFSVLKPTSPSLAIKLGEHHGVTTQQTAVDVDTYILNDEQPHGLDAVYESLRMN